MARLNHLGLFLFICIGFTILRRGKVLLDLHIFHILRGSHLTIGIPEKRLFSKVGEINNDTPAEGYSPCNHELCPQSNLD